MFEKKKTDFEKHQPFSPVTVIMLVVLIVYSLTLFGLFIWGILTAFKDPLNDFRTNTYGLPQEWCWNFGYVFDNFKVPVANETFVGEVGFGKMLVNSLLYALGGAFVGTLVPCITAYMCARFPYKFSKLLYATVLVVMVIPVVGNLPAEIQMARDLHLYGKIWGMWIMRANFLGMYFLVFHAAFKSQPIAYTEAARIDGANNMQILTRVSLPLVRNTFFTVMLINFIALWNDYQIPLVYLPSNPTIALGLYHLTITPTQGMNFVPMRITAAIIMLIPILITFLVFQKRLLGNLTVGGVKG